MSNRIVKKKSYISLFVVFIGAFLLCAAVIFPLIFNTKKEGGTPIFRKACQTHTKILRDHYTALLLPGSGDNTSRQQLNINLQIILTKNISDNERFHIAQTSVPFSENIQDQIENIIKETVILETSVKELEQFSNVFYLQKDLLSMIDTTIEKTKEYIEKTQHIQKTLSLMNTQSEEIFARIIKEGGSLSTEHINKLNEDISFAEQNFDSLTKLYKDATELKEKINISCFSFISETTN
ncbi:MAG: hypothetical protein KAS07_05165 [Candidatus Pacebacteria bacterium]|nr:hypothetical protein [Candidatus Paceibacterota bacterium]